METIVTFYDTKGIERSIKVEGPGTNFGARVSPDEVLRIMWECGDDLPFHIMAAGYGQDDDWVGLDREDILEGEPGDLRRMSLADFRASGWEPFEVSVEVPVQMGRDKFFGADMNRLALMRCGVIENDPIEDVIDALTHGAVIPQDFIDQLREAGYIITPDPDTVTTSTRDNEGLYKLLWSGTWVPGDEPGTTRLQRTYAPDEPALEDLFGWECVSCREDVGWTKHASVEQDAQGHLTFFFTCGHCGYDAMVDVDGNDIE